MYFLAEATKTLSLVSDTSFAGDEDEIWFGNASIPRSEGISESSLAPNDYTASSEDGSVFTAPARVINDITKDPQYADRDYAGKGVTFYCGVPIITDSGIPIGVYTLSDDKPRNGLASYELRFLCDMATTVMRHLDTVRNEAARFRGENMIAGLGRFIRGFSSVGDRRNDTMQRVEHHEDSVRHIPSHSRTTSDARETRKFKGLTITEADPLLLRPILKSTTPSIPNQVKVETSGGSSSAEIAMDLEDSATDLLQPTQPPSRPSKQHSTNTIFSRAANILRECASADGVVFFDAVSTNFAQRSSVTEFKSANQTDGLEFRPEKHSKSGTFSTESHDRGSTVSFGLSGESDDAGSAEETDNFCKLLGYSIDLTETPAESWKDLREMALRERTIRKLIKKYPDGKVFYFNNDGKASSSDVDQSTGNVSDVAMNTAWSETSTGTRVRMDAYAKELKRVLPLAQSVIWLPMWDFSKQRWSAGALLWSRRHEQLVMAQDNLIYLKAFANSIMIEVARTDAALSDEAKATFIANISHELRSPLHGIIGNCEILQDTSLDHFQASLVTAIELCGRTLHDTFDHVLDYAKINHHSKRGRTVRKSSRGTSFKSDPLGEIERDKINLESDFDLSVLVEEVVETVYVSRSYRPKFEAMRNAHTVPSEHNKSDAPNLDPRSVQVAFRCEKRDNWIVRSEPGAIQRILINLFSNALKYTDSGLVEVLLSASTTAKATMKHNSRSEDKGEDLLDIALTIRDTGRGMSDDFVRNHAFTPFTQESSFSEGTGLGLSIVQQLVSSLGGKIDLKSKSKVGTEFVVHLSLQQPPANPSISIDAEYLHDVAAKTAGLSIGILSYSSEDQTERLKRHGLEAAMTMTARTWFGMQVTKVTSPQNVKTDFLLYLLAPSPDELNEKCASGAFVTGSTIIALTATVPEVVEVRTRCADQFAARGLVLEVMPHPVGPRKFANVLSTCMARKLAADSTGQRKRSLESIGGTGITRRTSRRIASKRQPKSDHLVAVTEPVSDETFPRLREPKTLRSVSEGPTERSNTASTSQTVSLRPHISKTSQGSPMPYLQIKSTDTALSITPSTPHERIRVLLVEDNPINLNILKVAMTRAKIAFATATNGLEAFETFKRACLDNADGNPPEQGFTHVLMDISMPIMDGIEATRQIRGFEKEMGLRRRRQSTLLQLANEIEGSVSQEQELDRATTSNSSANNTEPQIRFLNVWNTEGESNPIWEVDRRPSLLRTNTIAPAVIIAISGVASDQTQRDMFTAGADIFMAKPVKPKEVTRLIRGEPVTST